MSLKRFLSADEICVRKFLGVVEHLAKMVEQLGFVAACELGGALMRSLTKVVSDLAWPSTKIACISGLSVFVSCVGCARHELNPVSP